MNIDDFKWIAPVTISLIALYFTYQNYLKVKKLDENSMIRLIVASETLITDFDTLRNRHSLVHIFPGEIAEDYYDELVASYRRVESKIELIFDLLLNNKKISDKDIRRIIKKLEDVESQFIELKHLKILSQDEMGIAQSYINPMYRDIEEIGSVLGEYDTK